MIKIRIRFDSGFNERKSFKMNRKKGLSIIVLVVFSLVIVSVFVTIGLTISRYSVGNNVNVDEENNLSSVVEKPLMDFSVCYERLENKGIIKIRDNSANIVMYTCLKVENGVTPNVGAADWSYNIQFEITEPGEYLVYGKDVNGTISDSVIINAEI